MDVWVNFTHATKWQAEGIFKCFFPCQQKPQGGAEGADVSQKNLPVPKRKAFKHAIPLLSEEEISELAKRFAAAIPEDELSVSAQVLEPCFGTHSKIGCKSARVFTQEQDSSD